MIYGIVVYDETSLEELTRCFISRFQEHNEAMMASGGLANR